MIKKTVSYVDSNTGDSFLEYTSQFVSNPLHSKMRRQNPDSELVQSAWPSVISSVSVAWLYHNKDKRLIPRVHVVV